MKIVSRTGLTEEDQFRFAQIEHELAQRKSVLRFLKRFRQRNMSGIAR